MQKIKRTTIFLLIGLLVSCFSLSCSAEEPSDVYITIKRPAVASEQIKSATEFYVRPINLTFIKPSDMWVTVARKNGIMKAKAW